MKYLSLLMTYIEQEYNVPSSFTPEMEEFIAQCWNREENIPNAAGLFHETFLKVKT